MPDERLYRAASGLEIRAGDNGDGVFEGYCVVFDHVDAYRSMFKKGSFAKTLQERGDRIKVKFDHEILIGRIEEAREDEKGVYVRGKLNLAVQAAKDVYEFLRDGTLDGLSFAFRSVKDHYEKGVRVFDEVQLYEIGPVCDPASDAAVITAVRESPKEDRAIDFGQTWDEKKARSGFWLAFMSLEETLHDIWWMGREQSGDAVIALIDKALTDAHGAMLEAAQQYISVLWTDDNREAPGNPQANTLALSCRAWLTDSNQTPEQAAANTALTLSEVRALSRGNVIADRTKLTGLPDSVQTAHRQARQARVEELCKELREGFSAAEYQRVSALLSRANREPVPTPDTEPDADMSALFNTLRSIRSSIGDQHHA